MRKFESLENREMMTATTVELFVGEDASNPAFVGQANEETAIIRADTLFGRSHFVVDSEGEFTELPPQGREFIWTRDDYVLFLHNAGTTMISRDTGEITEAPGYSNLLYDNPYNLTTIDNREEDTLTFVFDSMDASFTYEHPAACQDLIVLGDFWGTECPEITLHGMVGESVIFDVYDPTVSPAARTLTRWDGVEFHQMGNMNFNSDWVRLARLGGVNQLLDLSQVPGQQIVGRSESGNSVWTVDSANQLYNVSEEWTTRAGVIEGENRHSWSYQVTDEYFFRTENRTVESNGREYKTGIELFVYDKYGNSEIVMDFNSGPRNSFYQTSPQFGEYKGYKLFRVEETSFFLEGTKAIQMPYDTTEKLMLGDKIVSLTGEEPEVFDRVIGDFGLDGGFGSEDIQSMFKYGKYETGEFAYDFEGDITGDNLVTSDDIIALMVEGHYQG